MEVRDSIPGLLAGVVGLAAGLLAAVFDDSVLGLLAGLAAVGATVSTLVMRHHLRTAAQTQEMLAAELKAARITASTHGSEPPAMIEIAEPTEAPPQPETEPMASPVQRNDDVAPLVDPLTGLFSQNFFNVALESRIAAARRHLRPISVVLIDVVRGLPASAEPSDPGFVAAVLKQALREADAASWLPNGHFALLLEDTPENGAIWTVERVRRKLLEGQDDLTVWAGVACYPAHAFAGEALLEAANNALISAREWRQDRIEVAIASD